FFPAGKRAFVYNFITRSLTMIDIGDPAAPVITSTIRATALPAPGTIDAVAQFGAELFFTGRGPEGRMSQESWGGCIVCHPNGRSDNVTHHFDAGPRQVIPLDGMFARGNPADQRALNWSAVRDENHDFELNTRNNFGGRGLIDDDRLFLALGGAPRRGADGPGPLQRVPQFPGAGGPADGPPPAGRRPALAGRPGEVG